MIRPLRIAFVTSHWQFGLSNGTGVRLRLIGDALRAIGDVSLLSCTAADIREDELLAARERYASVTVTPERVTPLRGIGDRLRHEFDTMFLNTHQSSIAPECRTALREKLKAFDLTWVHTVRAANIFGVDRWPRSVLDVDDLHSQLYTSMASEAASRLDRLRYRRMAWLWRARERRFPDRFDSLAVCSEVDRDALQFPAITEVVPNGFDIPEVEPRFAPRGQRIGFIGLLDYGPNRDGMEWFVSQVWPRVKQSMPGARLRVVGRGADPALQVLGKDVDLLGYVPDATAEMATWSATIVPVRFGAGTRVKIAEAFSRKCPVVSTSLGAFGYRVDHGQEIMLADSAQDFASLCALLLAHPEVGMKLSEAAWGRFKREWSRDAMSRAVESCVERTLKRTSTGARLWARPVVA